MLGRTHEGLENKLIICKEKLTISIPNAPSSVHREWIEKIKNLNIIVDKVE